MAAQKMLSRHQAGQQQVLAAAAGAVGQWMKRRSLCFRSVPNMALA